MNMYVNLCRAYTEKSETLTLDVPPDKMETFMQYVHVLADEKNISARRAFEEMVQGTYEQLMEKDYERKNRKNAKRRGRNR
tara:strand:- start:26505 stop:26747 length:243 start_codon:yes stop_codon:yes gene_type:complete